MSEQINEQISALLDGELPEAELSPLLSQIAKQPELLQHAQSVQQTRLCLQGEKPSASISSSFRFTARIQDAIRDEAEFPVYDLSNQQTLAAQLGVESQTVLNVGTTAIQGQAMQATISSTEIDISHPAANDSGKWRPLFGAGVAAAVALVAVSAWQSQSSIDQDVPGLDTPLSAQTQFDQGANPSILSTQTGQGISAEPKPDASTSSYTVPDISGPSVDTPFAAQGDFRPAKYSSYLLQNQVAPQSTSTHLSQFAQQLRTGQVQQIFIDPRTGNLVMLSTSSVEKRQ